jgi:hypothetical protein
VIAFRDVSERERLIAQLQETIRRRDELLALAAHELRAPISSMRLAVQNLRSGGLSPEAMPHTLDIIDRGQRRVAALVDKLLDLGHIQSGTLKLELEPTDLVELVHEVVARHADELCRCGSTLRVSADQSVVGSWDRLRLEQVVTTFCRTRSSSGPANRSRWRSAPAVVGAYWWFATRASAYRQRPNAASSRPSIARSRTGTTTASGLASTSCRRSSRRWAAR